MPPDAFVIRDATSGDAPAIAAIYGPEVETGVASFEEIAPGEAEMAARMTRILGQGLPYLAAESQGEVIGYAYAGPFHPRAAYRYTLEDTVYIRRDSHRRGVGRALLGTLIQRAEALGCRQMIALITHAPDSPSIALHAAMGFRLVGVTEGVGWKFGRWLDMTFMHRGIGAGAATPPDRPILGPRIDG
jgi:phosphinothricin acetyltransferase